jgi:hypothetical protein
VKSVQLVNVWGVNNKGVIPNRKSSILSSGVLMEPAPYERRLEQGTFSASQGEQFHSGSHTHYQCQPHSRKRDADRISTCLHSILQRVRINTYQSSGAFLAENLTVAQLVMKFIAFCGTQTLFIVFTKYHWTISCASLNHSPSHFIRSNQ